MSDVIIRPIDIARDAESLAVMWNESDLQWPGSWNDGLPLTPEMVRLQQQELRMDVVYVAEVDGKIVGYCSFMEGHHGQEGEGYLALLNVHPDYQKRSIGRRLIQATIERSVEKGWQRQTLGTWSANFKAVPTYKKTGHFWTPDTSVWMQNYIPGALQLSLAKPFFERHNWYNCYVRELAQAEDDQRWEGLKVFTQHWEADGEALTIWIDREARAPVAVETDALQVAALAEEIEPLAGSKTNLRWRVINKSAEPVHVYLHALGDKGLEIDHRDAFVVPAGQTEVRTAQVKVAESAPRSKDDGTAPAVRSIIRLNGDEVELFSGLRVRKPLSLDAEPAQITLSPGVPGAVKLQLHSELDRPLDATLRITPPEGLRLDWTCRDATIPAKGHITLPLSVTCADEGAYSLPIRVTVNDKQVKPLNESVTLFSLPAGGLLVHNEGKSARLETDSIRISAAAKDGTIKITYKDLLLDVASINCRIGPPYYPSEFEKEFELEVKTRAGRSVVHLSAEAKHHVGLYLHQEFSLSPTGLGTLCCYLENRGSEAHTTRLDVDVRSFDKEMETFALPLADGIIHSRGGVFPWVWDDAPHDPAKYSEPWIAWERRGSVAGVAWDGWVNAIAFRWTVGLRSGELTLQPGQRSPKMRVGLYAGTGSWQTARDALLRWAGRRELEKAPPQARPAAWARFEPAVMVTASDEVFGRLMIGTVSRRRVSMDIAVRSPQGLLLDPKELVLRDLTRDDSHERRVRLLLTSGRTGVFGGDVSVAHSFGEERSPFHVVRLGTEAPVSVTQSVEGGQAVWTMDNGVCQFRVAPAFGPSLIGWQYGGENQLYSAFPEPRGFAWIYPWFGGLHTVLTVDAWSWEGILYRESISAAPLEASDAAGLVWRGVRLSVRPEKKELHDLAVEVDYLTLGQSRALKYVYRLRNLRGSVQEVQPKSFLACGLGTDPTGLVLRGEGLLRRPEAYAVRAGGEDWGMLTNEQGPAAGRTMLLVSQQSDVMPVDVGVSGRVLAAHKRLRLAGDETHELVYYLVLADSPDEAREYLMLKDYGR